jgi:hypothetical protein
MVTTYQFRDGPSWGDVKENYDFDHPKMRTLEEDVRRHGVRIPIPVDYEQKPPKVVDGHTRLAMAERVGLKRVPTEHHDEFDYWVFGPGSEQR